MKKLIELKGVSRTYGNGDQTRTVLKNVDLTIVAGEMVAISTWSYCSNGDPRYEGRPARKANH